MSARQVASDQRGHSRRQFLGGSLAVASSLWSSPALLSAGIADPSRRLWFGAATADITPDLPAALTGFQTVRLTSTVQSPLTANVLALESRQGDHVYDQAILVSCDLCVFRAGLLEELRRHIGPRVPGFDLRKLIVAVTHTHSAPVLRQEQYDAASYGDAMQPKDYLPRLFQRIAEAVEQAWMNRAPGSIAWGLGHAVVGHNRRLVYADGHAQMLGNANTPEFRQIEGYEDHSVDMLGLYDDRQALQALAVSVACPAQMSQGETVISADFWHDARELLRARYGQDLCVLGFCAPAGDQCPHLSLRQKSEARMDRLRGLSRTQELGRRIGNACLEVADVMASDLRDDAPLTHLVRQVELPSQRITAAEYATARKVCDEIDAKPQPQGWDTWVRRLYGGICDRYLAQQHGKLLFETELHVLRLGEVAIATSPFELYLDYGIQIQARSPAEQTFLIQLAAAGEQDPGYLPSVRAMQGGPLTDAAMNNYSATVMSTPVGPEGGQVLVDRTVEMIAEAFVDQPPVID